MNILITGGCGFVGANLSLYLKKKKFNIFSLDNLSRKGSSFNYKLLKKEKIKNYKIDISDYNKIKKLKKFEIIIDTGCVLQSNISMIIKIIVSCC